MGSAKSKETRTIEIEKGKTVIFEVEGIAKYNRVVSWEGATAIENTEKTKASLVVEKDVSVIVNVEGKDYTLTFAKENTGGSFKVNVSGHAKNAKGEWEDITTEDIKSPAALKGDDSITFEATPDKGYAVEYWSVKEGDEEELKDYEARNTKYLHLENNTDVKVKFRNYYIFKHVVSPDKVEGATIEATINGKAPEEVRVDVKYKDKIDGKIKTEEKLLGYKVKDGETIHFRVTLPADYEVKEWQGLGLKNDPDKTKLERDVVANKDITVRVVIKKKKK